VKAFYQGYCVASSTESGSLNPEACRSISARVISISIRFCWPGFFILISITWSTIILNYVQSKSSSKARSGDHRRSSTYMDGSMWLEDGLYFRNITGIFPLINNSNVLSPIPKGRLILHELILVGNKTAYSCSTSCLLVSSPHEPPALPPPSFFKILQATSITFSNPSK